MIGEHAKREKPIDPSQPVYGSKSDVYPWERTDLLALIHDSVFIRDMNGAVRYWNPAAQELYGWTATEVVGAKIHGLLHTAFPTSRAEAEAAVLRDGRWEGELVQTDRTGRGLVVASRWSLVREDSGAPVAIMEICSDLTRSKHTEDKLQRSEAYLAESQRLTHTGSFAWVPPLESLQYCSEELYRILDFDPRQGLPSIEAFWGRIHPDDVAGAIERVQEGMRAKSAIIQNVRIVLPDGSVRYCNTISRPVLNANGDIVEYYGTTVDVTERRRSEILLAGEKRILEMVTQGDSLARILESLCLLVEELAPDVLASILLIEDGRLKHHGAPSLPRGYIEAVDGITVAPDAGFWGAVAYSGKQVAASDIATDPLWSDYREAALANSLRACWATPIRSSDGAVVGVLAKYYREPSGQIPRDREVIERIKHLAEIAIQRRLTEERLQRSEAYLTEAQRLTQTGCVAWAPPWNGTRFCSEELLRIFGFDPKGGLPSAEAFAERMHPEDGLSLFEAIQEALARKGSFVHEFRIVLPDGTIKHIETSAHPLFDDNGDVAEYIGIGVDITARKRAEAERERLRQLEVELAHLNRLTTLGELAASLAHELNQPIAAAITNASACLRWLSRDEPDLPEARSAAQRIVRDGSRAAEIIDRVRSLYKKGTPPRREPVDVSAVVGEMLVLLRGEAVRWGITMRTDLGELPDAMADRVQLQQVFMNLMLNGIEAMRDAPGDLTIRSRMAGDDELLISVSDTGPGLPDVEPDELFKALFTTKPQGTGMGLAISRTIVEAHGGRLWAANNSGPGATFYFTMPRETNLASS